MSYVEPFNRQEIIDLAKAAYDEAWYDTAYTLKRFLVGDYDYTKSLQKQPKKRGNSNGARQDILPVYGDIEDNYGGVGVQNHALVNSRINVWNTIFSVPKFDSDLADPSESSINDAWMNKMWVEGNWTFPLSDCGFSYEATGVGLVKFGMVPEGRPQMRYQDVHDSLWDFMNRNPSEWQWMLLRDWLGVKDALKKYGHLWEMADKSPEENAKEAEKQIRALSSNFVSSSGRNASTYRVMPEWEFWHCGAHCTIIGTLENGIMCNWNPESGKYEMANPLLPRDRKAMAGANPFGIIPVAAFVDTTLPNVRRPVSKKKTSIGPISLANRLEKSMERVIANAPMLNLVAVGALEPEVAKRLMAAMDGNSSVSLEELGEVILVDSSDDVTKAVTRIAGAELSQSTIALRAMMKQEINAAEGVDDASRGQRNASERITAEEIRRFADVQGGQADHMRKQYSLLMGQVWKIARHIGSQYFWWSGTINFQHEGKLIPYDLSRYPIKPFLAKPSIGTVTPDSLLYMSEESRREMRIKRLMTVDALFMKMGVLNPQAVAQDVYSECYGIKDITPLLAQAAPPSAEQLGIPPDAASQLDEAMGTARQT